MKIVVLASGSKGNSTYIEYNNTKILIDIGISCLSLEKKLREFGVSCNELDAVLITHTHTDHIGGLKTFSKKYDVPIYMTEIMLNDIDYTIKSIEYIYESILFIKDLSVKVIKTSHDVDDSNAYIIKGDKEVVYITDTGYINRKYYRTLLNKEVYIFESNHDVELLMNSKYPYHVKTRILGDRGHLSNKDSAYYLSKLVGNSTKYVVLAHLSEENNTDELALSALNNSLAKENKNVEHIEIAHQKESICIEV